MKINAYAYRKVLAERTTRRLDDLKELIESHRSTEALSMYERITPAQYKAVSTILTSGEKKEYRKELQTFSTNLSPSVGLPNIARSQSMNIYPQFNLHQPCSVMDAIPTCIYQGPEDHSEPKKK